MRARARVTAGKLGKHSTGVRHLEGSLCEAHLFSSAEDGRVWVFCAQALRKLHSLRKSDSRLACIRALGGGTRLLTVDHTGLLRVWDYLRREVLASSRLPSVARVFGPTPGAGLLLASPRDVPRTLFSASRRNYQRLTSLGPADAHTRVGLSRKLRRSSAVVTWRHGASFFCPGSWKRAGKWDLPGHVIPNSASCMVNDRTMAFKHGATLYFVRLDSRAVLRTLAIANDPCCFAAHSEGRFLVVGYAALRDLAVRDLRFLRNQCTQSASTQTGGADRVSLKEFLATEGRALQRGFPGLCRAPPGRRAEGAPAGLKRVKGSAAASGEVERYRALERVGSPANRD